jgi:hypothetical protein
LAIIGVSIRRNSEFYSNDIDETDWLLEKHAWVPEIDDETHIRLNLLINPSDAVIL